MAELTIHERGYVVANYQYKSVAFPSVVRVDKQAGEVTDLYDKILNDNSDDGWEFCFIDTITTHKPPGCFGSGGAETLTFKIAIFRKLVE